MYACAEAQSQHLSLYLALSKYCCMNGNTVVEQGQEYTFVWSLDPNCPGLLQALSMRCGTYFGS